MYALYKLILDETTIAKIEVNDGNVGANGETLDGRFKSLDDHEYIVAVTAGLQFLRDKLPTGRSYN